MMKKSIVGIEMDSKEIRAVELSGTKRKPEIINWAKIELPEGVVKEGRVADKQLLPAYLTRLFNENGFKSKYVILGINNNDVIMRLAVFPKVPMDKMNNMIRFQAGEYIPVPIEEIELDYIVLEEKNTEIGEQVSVLLVGARKKMLNDFIDAFTKANLTICEIDSTLLAVGRSALINNDDSSFVLVVFNYDIANILIFSNGILSVTRSVSIANSFEPNITHGQRMERIADILLTEIKTSIGYHKIQNNENIEKIIVMGNREEQEIIAGILQDTTGLSVKTLKTNLSLNYKRHKGDLRTIQTPDYLASISLAFRGLGD